MKKIFSPILFAGVLLLTGCRNSPPAEISSRPDLFAESETAVTEQTDPPESGQQSSEQYPESETLRSVSGGIKNSPATYAYDGSPITVTYLFSADGCPAVGFMVFCDGQPVPYHTPDEPEDRLIHTAPITVPNQQEEINLILTPAGRKGDHVTLQVCDIVDPLYDLEKLNTNDSQFLQMIRGQKGRLAYGWPATVNMYADGIAPETDRSANYTRSPIPTDVLRSMEYQSDNGTTHSEIENLRSECTVEGMLISVYYALGKDDSLTMHLRLYGGNQPEVSVHLMMNWEPAPVFDGKTVIRVPVSEDQYTDFDLVLDASQIPAGRYLCSLVITPTENLILSPHPAFVVDIPE